MNETGVSITYQIARLQEYLFTPTGMLLLLLVPLLTIALLGSTSLRWMIVAITLWLSTFGVFGELRWYKPVLIAPLETLRMIGKPMVLLLLVVMLPTAFFGAAGWRSRRVSGVAVAYFIFLFLIGVRMLSAGQLERGGGQMAAFILTFLVFGVGMSRWIQDPSDARRALKAISWSAIFLIIGSLIQVVIDSKQVVIVNRLMGTTTNPQFLSSILGLSITPTIYLLMESREAKLGRLVLAIAIGFMMVCIIWTGSRTGVLMAAINLLVFFRLRVGKMLIGVIVGGLSLWVAAQFFTNSFDIADRLLSTADTRSGSWAGMFADFVQHPFFGAVGESQGYAENAYLAVASQYGLIGLIPGAILLIIVFRLLKRMLQIRPYLGQDGALCDVILGGLISFLVACMFDAYPLAIVGFHVLYMYIYFAISGSLIQAVEEGQLYPQDQMLPVDNGFGAPMIDPSLPAQWANY